MLIEVNYNSIVNKVKTSMNASNYVYTERRRNIYYRINSNSYDIDFIFPDEKVLSLMFNIGINRNMLYSGLNEYEKVFDDAIIKIIKSMNYVLKYTLSRYTDEEISSSNIIKYNFVNTFNYIKRDDLLNQTKVKSKYMKYMIKFSKKSNSYYTVVFSTVLHLNKKLLIENDFSRIFIPYSIYQKYNGDINKTALKCKLLPVYDDRKSKGIDKIETLDELKPFIEIVEI